MPRYTTEDSSAETINRWIKWVAGHKALSGVVVFVVLIGIFALIPTEEDVAVPEQPSPEELEAKRKGFHCLSDWDGNHSGLEALVEDNLNDPGSMETLETRIAPVDDEGLHWVSMEFTAKNAFGGRVRHIATGWVGNATCTAVLTAID